MKILLLLLFFVLSFTGSRAQSDEVVYEVYRELVEALGEKSRELPELIILDRQKNVAAFRRADNRLIIERKAIEVCRSFGAQFPNAIAFLLGHELTHFYQNHVWGEAGFSTAFLASGENYQSHLEEEKEADLYGAFLAWMAGYETVNLLPLLLDALYEAYQLNENDLINYPPLELRQLMATEICHKADRLIQIYQSANYLSAIGQYHWAANCYQFVLKFIRNKELHNNLGVALLASALQLHSADRSPWYYPLEVDYELTLRQPGDYERATAIDEAIQHFRTAVSYDNRYFTGFLNLACALDLDGQFEQAADLINQLERVLATPESIMKILLAKGIVAAHRGDRPLAEASFRWVMGQGPGYLSELGEKNLAVLHGEYGHGLVNAKSPPVLNERMDGMDLRFLPETDPGETILLSQKDPLFHRELKLTKLANSTLFTFQSGAEQIALQQSSQLPTSQGFKKGDPAHKIKNGMKAARTRKLHHDRGYFLVYPGHSLIFSFNQQERLLEWVVFARY